MDNHVLFEIGVEELPARFIDQAEKDLQQKTINWLVEERLSYTDIFTYSTPRRLAILIRGIADKQTTLIDKVRGPKLTIAKDQNSNWSKAAIGFLKSQGKDPADIFIEEIKGESYVFVEKRIEGKDSINVLQNFPHIIESLNFPQTMRWGEESFRFARPIRWLVALFNDQVIPFKIAGVQSDRVSFGHRFLGGEISLRQADEYEMKLEENYVIANKMKREKIIIEQLEGMESAENFHIVKNKALLNEVRNLVEYPTAFFGSYEEEYLSLPTEVLITSMQEHQRYFPVFSEIGGRLLPYFVSVRNGDALEISNVVRGNEKVLRARLADARFFYEEDKQYNIDYYLEKLKTVIYHEKLGTIFEKSNRIVSLTEEICTILKLSEKEIAHAKRAAEICKFDLVTHMVNEFPELQGVMGEKYASHFGEKDIVAQAVKEHYYPLQANSELPTSLIGAVVSIADKLDTVAGSISVGLIPTGSQDPYGLRRQTIGIMRIIKDQGWNISVESFFQIAKKLHDNSTYDSQLTAFITDRAAYLLQEQKISADIIRAILDTEIGVLSYAIEKGKLLAEKRNDPQFKHVQEAFVRILNLAKSTIDHEIDPSLLQTDSEHELYEKLGEVSKLYDDYSKKYDAANSLAALELLAQPIHLFFEHNMVMDKNELIKSNRLALVSEIAKLMKRYANLTLIEWKQHK